MQVGEQIAELGGPRQHEPRILGAAAGHGEQRLAGRKLAGEPGGLRAALQLEQAGQGRVAHAAQQAALPAQHGGGLGARVGAKVAASDLHGHTGPGPRHVGGPEHHRLAAVAHDGLQAEAPAERVAGGGAAVGRAGLAELAEPGSLADIRHRAGLLALRYTNDCATLGPQAQITAGSLSADYADDADFRPPGYGT